MTGRRKLYIVDDEAIVRVSIVSLVQAHGDYDCREYSGGEGILAALDRLDPGVVVLDLQLDGVGGADVMRALARRADRFPVIIVTGFSDIHTAIDAFRAGAVEFFQKPYEIRPLLHALDRAFHKLEHGDGPAALAEEAHARLQRLDSEERDILRRLVNGDGNLEIARQLGADPRRIERVRAQALAKLDAGSIIEAIRLAALAGYFAEKP